MKDKIEISDKKLEKRAKTFSIDQEKAASIIYEECDMVEYLFHAHKKTKFLHHHFVDEINKTCRIA